MISYKRKRVRVFVSVCIFSLSFLSIPILNAMDTLRISEIIQIDHILQLHIRDVLVEFGTNDDVHGVNIHI